MPLLDALLQALILNLDDACSGRSKPEAVRGRIMILQPEISVAVRALREQLKKLKEEK